MMMLFDKEYILKNYVESEKLEAAREGEKRGFEKTKTEIAQRLYKKGNYVEDIADICDAPVKEVEQWLGLVRA